MAGVPSGPFQPQTVVGNINTQPSGGILFLGVEPFSEYGGPRTDGSVNAGQLVQVLGVWADDYQIAGMLITYTNGNTAAMIGRQSGNYQQITFQPGETISQATLWSGVSQSNLPSMGRLYISTSKGQTLDISAGKYNTISNDAAAQNIGSGLLAGFAGTVLKLGSFQFGITGLCFVLVNPVSSISIDNVQFTQSIIGTANGISPQALDTATYTWDGKPYNYTFQGSVTQTNTQEMSQTASMMYGVTASVEATFFKIVKASTSFQWQYTTSTTQTSSVSTAFMQSWGTSGSINSAADQVTCQSVCSQGKVNVPYTADVTIVMKDGTSWKYNEPGTFNNVLFTAAEVDVQPYPPPASPS
jgi:hypothetical protein